MPGGSKGQVHCRYLATYSSSILQDGFFLVALGLSMARLSLQGRTHPGVAAWITDLGLQHDPGVNGIA